SAAGAKLRSLSVQSQGDTGYWVLAPRAGSVVQLDAVAGKQVGPDREHPVATIADLDEVLVVADLPQKDAAVLDPGGGVVVRLPGSQVEVAGTIDVISDVLDADRQTVPVRVRVANEVHKLRPHSYVEATFSSLPDERVVQVPSEAVVSDGSTSVVFVETEPGVLRRRPVQLGRQSAERAEVMSGLNAGERVVVRGALLLLNALDVKG
ncbi:MAG: efflux RND transporter periplasmic adaptor subunit, partial [Myxococcales bacterium]